MHITTAPYTDELLVLPTRAMDPDDAAYAVACAVPANTPGVKIIAQGSMARDGEQDYSRAMHFGSAEGLIIFEDVFVPHERVFLKGEWPAAGWMAYTFANFHRFTAACYKYPQLELLAGKAFP